MSLQDDYAHLTQLASELPIDHVQHVDAITRFAGEEAALVLGHGHPDITHMNELIAQVSASCDRLIGDLHNLAALFASYQRR